VLLQQANAGVGGRAIIRAGFWRLSAIGIAALFGFCSLLLVARALGPELFGQYAFALWLAATAAPVAGASLPALSSRAIANLQSPEKPGVVANIFSLALRRCFRGLVFYCLLSLSLIGAYAKFSGNIALVPLLLAGLCMLVRLAGGIASMALRALRRFDLLAAMYLLGAAATLLLVLLGSQIETSGPNQVYLFLLAPAVAGVLTLCAFGLCAGRLLRLKEPFRPGMELNESLTGGVRSSLLPVILDAVVWQHAEVVALGGARAYSDLGCYLLCVMISGRLLQALPVLYTTCILPLRLRVMPGRRSINAAEAYRKTMLGMAWLALATCASGVVFCPGLISLCFGAAYLPAVAPLRILLVATALGSISSISVTRLAHEERTRAQDWLRAAGALLTLSLAWPLSASAGVTGTAIASAIAQCVCAAGTMVIDIRKMRARKAS